MKWMDSDECFSVFQIALKPADREGPEKHYMVDLSEKVQEIKKLVDAGKQPERI